MKKKGLIIATIVMVLVLAVSLTTATYAWFAASTTTTVDTLTLKVDSASAVAIGAKTANTYNQDSFMYGSVTLGNDTSTVYNPLYTGGETGLGSSLSLGTGEMTLTLSKAINSATSIVEGTSVTGATSSDGHFDPATGVIYAASSSTTDTTIDNASIAYARANTDFVCLQMGAQAAQNGVYGIYATVTTTATDTATTLKMMAAMHFYIRVYTQGSTSAGKWVEFDLFGTATENTSKASVGSLTAPITNVTYAYSESKATATFKFLIGGVSEVHVDGENVYEGASGTTAATPLATDGSKIFMFDIYSYIWGPDANCKSTGTGCSASFDITFDAVTKTSTTAGNLITLSNNI